MTKLQLVKLSRYSTDLLPNQEGANCLVIRGGVLLIAIFLSVEESSTKIAFRTIVFR